MKNVKEKMIFGVIALAVVGSGFCFAHIIGNRSSGLSDIRKCSANVKGCMGAFVLFTDNDEIMMIVPAPALMAGLHQLSIRQVVRQDRNLLTHVQSITLFDTPEWHGLVNRYAEQFVDPTTRAEYERGPELFPEKTVNTGK